MDSLCGVRIGFEWVWCLACSWEKVWGTYEVGVVEMSAEGCFVGGMIGMF